VAGPLREESYKVAGRRQGSVASFALLLKCREPNVPLSRGNDDPDADAWGVDFDMIAADGPVIPCFVTSSALDQLLRDDGSITIDGQLAVFEQWREAIETTASHKYDSLQIERGFVVVRSEDLKARPGTLQ
jgi:hypothetical protein